MNQLITFSEHPTSFRIKLPPFEQICIYASFMYSCISKYFCCFPVLAIVSNTAMNRISSNSGFMFLSLYMDMGMLNHIVVLCLTIWEISIEFLVAEQIYIPVKSLVMFHLFYTLTKIYFLIYIYVYIYIAIITDEGVDIKFCFDLHFLVD